MERSSASSEHINSLPEDVTDSVTAPHASVSTVFSAEEGSFRSSSHISSRATTDATRATNSVTGDEQRQQLLAWFESISMSEYADVFLSNDLSIEFLPDLRKEDLKPLVPKVGDRLRIWKHICELAQEQYSHLEHEDANRLSTSSSSPSLPGSRLSFLSNTSIDSNLVALNSAASGDGRVVDVKFYTPGNKALNLEIVSSSSGKEIKNTALALAKLPKQKEYRFHDSFDFYDDDDSFRKAIFERDVTEFWIHLADDHSSFSGSTLTLKGTNTTSIISEPEKDQVPDLKDRPTSLQVAQRILEYFPEASPERLKEGMRNSVLINRRLSTLRDWRASVRLSRRTSILSTTDIEYFASSAPQITLDLGEDLEKKLGEVTIGRQDLESALLERLDREEMSPTEWTKGRLIGKGSFGSVYLAFNMFSGDLMAVKQIQLMESAERRKHMIEALHREIRLLRELAHENIVQYRGFTSEGNYQSIFLEYVPGGSLATKLMREGPLSEELVRLYIFQCLSGLAYLHNKGIIHRDIKGANILVDTNNRVKISDFGLSKHEEPNKQRYSMQGTAFWMAPEVARASEQTTTKADIWSLGCLIIELITGQHPYPKLQPIQALYKVGKGFRPDIPEGISENLRDLIDGCLRVDPKERESAKKLLEHPFFAVK